MSESFKTYEELYKPDFRSSIFVLFDHKLGTNRHWDLKDIHDQVKLIELADNVPDDIKSQFNIARNLSVYSWFSYSFHQICELKAFSTLEYALRYIYGLKKEGLKKLISYAVRDGYIRDRGFSHLSSNRPESSTEYSNKLVELIPNFRNDLAHGSTTLHDGSLFTLRFCADFVNQLFQIKTVSGVDGCKAGWICIAKDLTTGVIQSQVYSKAELLLQENTKHTMIAVDIPIGLTASGKRTCDEEARRLLKARQSSVFDAPIRPILNASNRKEADDIRRRVEGNGVSAQTFGILKKVRDFDQALSKAPHLQRIVKEVHPELCFWAMNNKMPMSHSKKSKTGFEEERYKLICRYFGDHAVHEVRSRYLKKDVSNDDILDAFAALWTAERIAKGEAGRIPEQPFRDEMGLNMEIWY